MSLAKLGLGHSWYLNTHFLPSDLPQPEVYIHDGPKFTAK